MKRTKPGIEEPVKTEEEMSKEVLKTFQDMTQMMTNLIGAQRETISLISTLGKIVMSINSQLDVVTKMVIGKENSNKIHLK